MRPAPGFRIVLAASLCVLFTTVLVAGDHPDFEREIAPILKNRCLECHSAVEKAGGLDLSNQAGLTKGGENGEVVDRDTPLESPILRRVAAGEMPPKKAGKPRPLPQAEVERLRAWVANGASWPEGRTLDPFESTSDARAGRDWWSLQPIRRPAIPSLSTSDSVSNPIDAFVLAQLAPKGWTLAPAADKRVLIRRVYQDLLGLPVSYEERENFAHDSRVDAYERLVDRVLASPHFGERWARHWLDLARFAETSGYERDQPKPFAWKYRDWVIQAFNDDKPYDRFVLEQLAGDELTPRSTASLIATGFLRLGTWNDEPNDPNEYKYERIEDVVHATSTAFLALTVKCARCHDHKFDPIRQTDYYRMAAAFWAGYIEPGPREWLGGPPPESSPEILSWTDRPGKIPDFTLLKKGDPARPGPVVHAGPLSFLPALERPFAPASAGSKTSQRRLQLAQWMVNPANPLTARVWANRLWGFTMGAGLVRSPDNFGFNGDRPTHPELLDWLASELMANGWRTKPILRQILLSQTYRQSSIHRRQVEYTADDAGNRLWWHSERRRVEAESLRDALLSASSRLDLSRIGGPSFYPEIAADALEGLSMKGNAWKASPPEQRLRRGLYSFTKRGLLSPLMTTFDLPDTTLPCGRRDVTLVAPQALALMNNAFVHEQSESLATQLQARSSSLDIRIRDAWRLILARDPRPEEIAAAQSHLSRVRAAFPAKEAELRALASLCHVLLNANEFLYVD